MKLILRDYLAGLKERDELERVIADLLSSMGLCVLTEPGRGTRQHGVDIAAFGHITEDSDSTEKLYLFTIKRGNIDRATWDGKPEQSLRPSINEITSTYLENLVPPQYAGVPKVVCICFGGKLAENINEDVSSYLKQEGTRLNFKKVTFQLWNGEKISDLLIKYLCSDRLLLSSEQKLLTKALALISEPEYCCRNFLTLVKALLSKKEETKSRGVIFHVKQVVLCLGVLGYWCEDVNNLDSVVRSLECCLLLVWDKFSKSDASRKEVLAVYNSLVRMYIKYEAQYLLSVEKFSARPFFYTYACNGNDEVDVNIKIFDTIGRIASFGLVVHLMAQCLRKDGSFGDLCNAYDATTKQCCIVLAQLFANNPTACSPILDEQVVDIGLCTLLWALTGNCPLVRQYINAILMRVDINFVLKRGYPTVGLKYRELILHIHETHDDEYRRRVLSSSELISYLAMIADAVGLEDEYALIVNLWKGRMPDTNLQMWFPGQDIDDVLWMNEKSHGIQLCSLDPTNRSVFVESISKELEQSKLPSCASGVLAGICFVANYVHRLPVFPQYWHLFKELRKGK